MLGWLNASLQSTETRNELSTTLYLQSEIIKVMSRCLSAPDAASLTPLPPEASSIFYYLELNSALDTKRPSVHSEKTHLKKLMMIIIMNKLLEITFFSGRQKLISAMKVRLEK